VIRSFHQTLYTFTIGGGGTGLRRRGSRLDEKPPFLAVPSYRVAGAIMSMQFGYHDQGCKN